MLFFCYHICGKIKLCIFGSSSYALSDDGLIIFLRCKFIRFGLFNCTAATRALPCSYRPLNDIASHEKPMKSSPNKGKWPI